VFRPHVLRYVTLCTATHIFFLNAFLAVLVLYLARDLGMSPALLGLSLSAGAVGGLAGSLLAARIGRRFGLGMTMAATIAVAGLGSIPLFFAEDTSGRFIAIVVGSQVLLWFALQVYNVHQVPVRYPSPTSPCTAGSTRPSARPCRAPPRWAR
jgi:MFS family permease